MSQATGRRGLEPHGEDEEPRSVAVRNFVDITQADENVARHMLEACDWNTENAVSCFLESGGIAEIPYNGGRGGESNQNVRPRRSSRQVNSRPIVIDDDEDTVEVDGDDGNDGIGDEDIRTLASYRTRRTSEQVNYNEDSEDDDGCMEEEDDAYGDEEERFKYGRRSRRGHRRRLRRVQGVCSQSEGVQDTVPMDVLNMPDVNIEEQKMLMAALTGDVYDGEIPDFRDTSQLPSYIQKPLSPGAVQRQMLREEQDLAFQESLEIDKQKEKQKELIKIGELERKESAKQEQEALKEKLEEKKRRLPLEPGPDDAECFVLVIRMPSGIRLKRRFSTNDNVQSAFDFIDVEGGADLNPGTYQLVSQVCILQSCAFASPNVLSYA